MSVTSVMRAHTGPPSAASTAAASPHSGRGVTRIPAGDGRWNFNLTPCVGRERQL